MGHRKLAIAAVVVGAAGFTGAAIAGGHGRHFDTDMSGYEEVPAISTTGNGEARASINRAGSEIRYVLRYRNLEAAPTQAHIHFGAERTAGGISVWLCDSPTNPSPRETTPACEPSPATI